MRILIRPSVAILSLLASAAFVPFASAARLTITIPASHILPNPQSLPASTHATLTTLSTISTSSSSSSSSDNGLTVGGPLKARLTRASTFEFDLSPSASQQRTRTSYLLDIHSRDHVFAPYRVDVGADGDVIGVWETYRGHPWGNKGAEKVVSGDSGKGDGNVAVEARVVGVRSFYEERPKFSPLNLLKSPMILMGVFALAMTFGMPYLMDNMDPELKEEFARQRTGGGAGSAAPAAIPGAGFDLAGWMAGTSPGPLETANKATSSGRETEQGPSRRRG